MLWPAVAHSYLRTFERASSEHAQRLRTEFRASTLASRPIDLPEVNLDHVEIMTDDTGMLQHAMFNVPRYEEGYCLDDNARALLLMTLLEDAGSSDPRVVRTLSSRYLAFVSHAFNRPLGRFRNFMSHSRLWQEEQGSEDSHGRALWALGTVVGCSADPGRHSLAGALFHAALPAVSTFSSPRAWAFTLLGIAEEDGTEGPVRTAIISAAGALLHVKVGDTVGDRYRVAAISGSMSAVASFTSCAKA